MKKSTLIALAMLVSACATTHTFESSPQFYRAKGQDDQTKITGKVEQYHKDKFVTAEWSNKVTIYFNGQPQIVGNLDAEMTGEFTGEPFNGKATSTSCSTKRLSKTVAELKCIVFIDNERAATVTM